MWVRACVGVSGLTLWCLVATLGLISGRAEARPCELRRLASVDLIVHNDELLVPVTLDGHAATMTLNIAGGYNGVIGSKYLKQLDLRQNNDNELTGPGFTRTGYPATTVFGSFSVGSLKYGTPLSFLVVPAPDEPSSTTVPHIGAIGMNLLAQTDFELDFANNKLNFYSSDHCPGVVVYWTDHYSSARIHRGLAGNFYFPMELQGKKVLAELSTTLPLTALGTDATQKLFGFDEKSPDVETETGADGHVVSHYRAMALTGNGITITNAHIQLRPWHSPWYQCQLLHGADGAVYRDQCAGAEAPLVLGLNIVRRLHLYFATKEEVLYFSDAAATK